jgi:hypothetical protein
VAARSAMQMTDDRCRRSGGWRAGRQDRQDRAEHCRGDVERTSRRPNSYEARLILTVAADGYCFQQRSQGSRFICQVAARPGSQVARRSAWSRRSPVPGGRGAADSSRHSIRFGDSSIVVTLHHHHYHHRRHHHHHHHHHHRQAARRHGGAGRS